MARTKKNADLAASTAIVAYKGFNQDLTCREFQYEVGKTYVHEGKVEACAAGFHACEHPLNVFSYYPPSSSRFAVVEMGGAISRDGSDTKIASAEITIKAEIKLPELIAAAVKFVFDRAKWTGAPVATGPNEAATASGTRGAATASGTRGAATASGYQGAATASGYQGAATASGEQGAATASGIEGKARGADGAALFLVERVSDWSNDRGKIVHVWAGVVGRDGIKADTWYMLRDGKPVEVA